MLANTRLRIVKKVKHEVDKSKLDGAYAWDCQWKLDDIQCIPRKVRGTNSDRRMI